MPWRAIFAGVVLISVFEKPFIAQRKYNGGKPRPDKFSGLASQEGKFYFV